MVRKRSLLVLCACMMALASPVTWACAGHLYLDTSKLGFFGSAIARMTGLAMPAPVFDLEHPAMLKAKIGEDSEFSVSYSRPFFSKNASMQLSGTANVELSQDIIALDERDGIINIHFQLTGLGFDSISLTIRGEHKGESVVQRRRIYIRAKVESSKLELQEGER